MPWTSKQHRLFEAVSHGWKPPASSGIHVDKAAATKMAGEGVIGDGELKRTYDKKAERRRAALGGS